MDAGRGHLARRAGPYVSGCLDGGFGNSEAEKPWAVFFQPYMKSRQPLFCPGEGTARTKSLANDILAYNGGTDVVGGECAAAPNGENCLAQTNRLTAWSYLLNSILDLQIVPVRGGGRPVGLATESVLAGLANPNVIIFSERNPEGFSDPKGGFYDVPQDDYDTRGGEAALVR